MKLMVVFRNFVNAPKNWCLVTFLYVICKPRYAASDRTEMRVQQEQGTVYEVTN